MRRYNRFYYPSFVLGSVSKFTMKDMCVCRIIIIMIRETAEIRSILNSPLFHVDRAGEGSFVPSPLKAIETSIEFELGAAIF